MGVSGVIGGHGGMAPQPALAAMGVLPAVRGRGEGGSTSTSVGFASRNALDRSPSPPPLPPPFIVASEPVGVPGSYRRISIWLARRLGPPNTVPSPLAVVVAVMTDSFRAVAVLAKP